MAEEKKNDKLVFISTCGPEDPERATFPFVMANAALAMDVEAVVALQGPSVWVAYRDTLEHVLAGGLPPLKQLVEDFISLGGRLLVCSPCIKHRQMDEKDLIEGAQVIAAAVLTTEILSANNVLNY
jgi:predicted peroxiredoxin